MQIRTNKCKINNNERVKNVSVPLVVVCDVNRILLKGTPDQWIYKRLAYDVMH